MHLIAVDLSVFFTAATSRAMLAGAAQHCRGAQTEVSSAGGRFCPFARRASF